MKEELNIDEDLTIEMDADIDDYLKYTNLPNKDSEGFVKGKLVKIEKTERLNKNSKNKDSGSDEDDTTKHFRFKFIMEGTISSFKSNILTGTSIRHDKFYNKPKGKGKGKQENPEYNKFTEICLRLNIISEKNLNARSQNLLSDITKAIKNISIENPLFIKAKLQKNEDSEKENSAFETIDVKSIQIIEAF